MLINDLMSTKKTIRGINVHVLGGLVAACLYMYVHLYAKQSMDLSIMSAM